MARRRRYLAGVAVGLGMTAAVMMPSPLLAAAANGLAIAGTTTYELDFPAGVVRVRLELSVENTVAPESDGVEVRSTYFTGWQVGVHGDATALAGHAGDEPIPVNLTSVDPEIQLLSITFPEDLDYGERQDLVVTWELPGLPPRSAAPWRTNEAFAAFVAYAYGDAGASAVRVVAPVGVDVGLPALGLDVAGGTGRLERWIRPGPLLRGDHRADPLRARRHRLRRCSADRDGPRRRRP